MKKYLILVLILFLSPIYAVAIQDSLPIKSIAILSDHITNPPTVYYNYPAASDMFATDTANQIRLRNNIRVITPGKAKEILSKTTYTNDMRIFNNQFRYNYNFDFNRLKPFAKVLGSNYILLITANIDAQSYILKGTIWNLLNIPGADVVNPVYQIVTNATLVDVDSETIIWQHVYRKNLKARDNSIIPAEFSPVNQQLKAVSDYSKTLSTFIANSVEEYVCHDLYFDKLGNRYNKKNTNSLVGKTKYYTQSVYENYVGIDVPGPNYSQRKQKNDQKKREQEALNQAKIEAQSSQTNKGQNKQLQQKFDPAQNNVIIDTSYDDELDEEALEKELEESNPMREYCQDDNIHMQPQKTPDAAGNKIDNL